MKHSIIAVIAALIVTATASSRSQVCCAALSHALPRKVLYPHDAQYAEANVYWSTAAQLMPTCIVTPKSSQDVSRAVKILAGDSKVRRCRFAIHSGGHMPWAGAANIEDGITIDLSGLNNINISEDRAMVSLGPGNKWADVYRKLDPLGLGVPGGRCGDVGVGGLIIGGGIPFGAALRGFVADNVKNFEIVLGSGKIVHANKVSHLDLYLALKGGSNNFGIVTRFDVTIFEQAQIWGGTIVNPIDTAPQQYQAISNFADNNFHDPFASLINLWAYSSDTGQTTIINILFHGNAEINPPIFHDFTSIEPQFANTLNITTMADLTTQQQPPPGSRAIFVTSTFANKPAMMAKVVEIGSTLLEPLKHTPNMSWSYSFEPLPRIFTDRSLELGGNVLGLDRTEDNLILFFLYISYPDPKDSEAFNTAAQTLIDRLTAYAKQIGAYNPFIYLNNASERQNPLRGYGEKNLKLLKTVSRKYDPEGVFQRLVRGGYKLDLA